MLPAKIYEYSEYVSDALEVVEFKLGMFNEWVSDFCFFSILLIYCSLFRLIYMR